MLCVNGRSQGRHRRGVFEEDLESRREMWRGAGEGEACRCKCRNSQDPPRTTQAAVNPSLREGSLHPAPGGSPGKPLRTSHSRKKPHSHTIQMDPTSPPAGTHHP